MISIGSENITPMEVKKIAPKHVAMIFVQGKNMLNFAGVDKLIFGIRRLTVVVFNLIVFYDFCSPTFT